MIARAFRSPLILAGVIAVGLAAACNSAADTTAVLKPAVASFLGDSTCADSVLSINTIADSGPRVAEGAAYSAQFTVSNSGADACYTSALAFAFSVSGTVYVDAPAEPEGRFLVNTGGDPAIVTGYYRAGDTTGFGFVGMKVGPDFADSLDFKFFIIHP